MALTVGSRLGHYDVTALIGEGGMGQVYQATDTSLKGQVALKILPEAFATDPDRLARFQREAEVLASRRARTAKSLLRSRRMELETVGSAAGKMLTRLGYCGIQRDPESDLATVRLGVE